MSQDENPKKERSTDKKPRKRAVAGQVSKTKQKGAPVVGKQAETLFGSGVRGNAPGLSRDQALQRYENGKLAERAQGIWLKTLVDKLEEAPPDALDQLRTDTLRLVQDAIDRANGKAVSSVDVTSSDGSASAPSRIEIVSVSRDNSDD